MTAEEKIDRAFETIRKRLNEVTAETWVWESLEFLTSLAKAQALQEREMPTQEEIEQVASHYDLGKRTDEKEIAFKAGVQWCLDWMKKGEKKC